MGSDFVKGELIEALLDVPGGVTAYDDRSGSCVAGTLRPIPMAMLLDAGVMINLGLITDLALRVIFRTRQDSPAVMSFHVAL